MLPHSVPHLQTSSFLSSVPRANETPMAMAMAPSLPSERECWSELPFPPPGDLPDPGIKPKSPATPALAGELLTTEPSGKPAMDGADPRLGHLDSCSASQLISEEQGKLSCSGPVPLPQLRNQICPSFPALTPQTASRRRSILRRLEKASKGGHLRMDLKLVRIYSTLAWKIPRMEEPGRLQSMALHRVGHD